MHPYAIEWMVQERRDELARLGQADHGARAARRKRDGRRRPPAGRLSALTVRIGRRARRPAVLEPCPRASVRPW
jgi:hypothetical protein